MSMLDKDFDNLFHSKLNEFELEPSAALWNNISGAINGPVKSKKNYLVYLQWAAAVIVIVGAGLFFTRPVEKINLQGQNRTTEVADAIQATKADVLIGNNPEAVEVDPSQTSIKPVALLPRRNRQNMAAAGNTYRRPVDAAPQDTAQNMLVQAPDNNSRLAMLTPASTVPVATANPGNGVTNIEPKPIKSSKLGTLASLSQKETTAKTKKKIHSLGDLLNIVIAKVDKRDDKVLEFTNNEDDESTFNVTGVNIGLIKLKKEK